MNRAIRFKKEKKKVNKSEGEDHVEDAEPSMPPRSPQSLLVAALLSLSATKTKLKQKINYIKNKQY